MNPTTLIHAPRIETNDDVIMVRVETSEGAFHFSLTQKQALLFDDLLNKGIKEAFKNRKRKTIPLPF